MPKSILPEELKNKKDIIFGEVKPFIRKADFSVVNLEAPIIKDKISPIRKSGPSLCVDTSTVEVLKDVGFDVFTLANNHFYDQGQTGVEETIEACLLNGVKVVGGGKNIEDARKLLILEKEDKRVAIINACEHEFSIATNEHGGSNPLDLINIQEDIENARKVAHYVVLILHGGIEHYQYPTPRMRRWYRHFVDMGADAVINHHQHCINGYEVYNSKPIFYGLGNFYFPWGSQRRPDSWKYGYAVELVLGDIIQFDLLPYKQTIDGVFLRDKIDFEREIELLNNSIKDDNLFIKFEEYISSRKFSLLIDLLPSFMHWRFIEAIVRRGVFGTLYHGKELYNVSNKLTCESHLEQLQNVFRQLMKKE